MGIGYWLRPPGAPRSALLGHDGDDRAYGGTPGVYYTFITRASTGGTGEPCLDFSNSRI
jgi:hypothetical protein